MKRTRIVVSGAAIVLAGALAWSRPGGAGTSSSPLAPSTQSEGARLFVAYNCADCHGRTLAAYVRTLDDGKDVKTMNFTEKVVDRPGH